MSGSGRGGVEALGHRRRQIFYEEVMTALGKLTSAQRTAFNLVEVEGCTYEDAAGEMRCSEVNVRALLCRAKERLREELGVKS